MSRNEEYNWLDDPFDEKKARKERDEAGMSSRSKLFVGVGCLAFVVVLVALGVAGASALGALLAL